MSISMFIIGFVIFFIYVVFLVWNIVYNGNKQEEENYPTIHSDVVDFDGIGNQGRVTKVKKRKKLKDEIKRLYDRSRAD
tara:strand:- start:1247 stop:1483 length:237 start_codon:yes stop_codon:yes gene_type:complete